MNEKPKPSNIVKITRSFTYKLNAGNYESRDFFCSQTAECYEHDTETVSARVMEFCRKQVLMDVRTLRDELVNAAGQTGTSLVTKGWTNGVTGVINAGDIISLAEIPSVDAKGIRKLSTAEFERKKADMVAAAQSKMDANGVQNVNPYGEAK